MPAPLHPHASIAHSLLMLALLVVSAAGFGLRGYGFFPSETTEAPVSGVSGNSCSGHCEYGTKESLTIRIDAPSQAPWKCSCTTSLQEDCTCDPGCPEEQQQLMCEEILGPCECQRSEQAICECSGYCQSRRHRQDACEDEPGCLWTGAWCEAQVGLLWS
mmetsp:Transcript_124341/g.264946  ORF Transcript_124341/g.264946 Transcript_124341/m.264946 type:complete len:160 (+) Transcript_124341:101-580(+)